MLLVYLQADRIDLFRWLNAVKDKSCYINYPDRELTEDFSGWADMDSYQEIGIVRVREFEVQKPLYLEDFCTFI